MADDLDDIPRNTNHLSTLSFSHRATSPVSPTSPTKRDHTLHRRLTLTSFSHRRGPLRGALTPTAGLSFDIRTLPNPPKRVRDVYVGTDKPMRTAFLEGVGVRERVDAIRRAVRVVLDQQGPEEAKEVEMHEADADADEGKGDGARDQEGEDQEDGDESEEDSDAEAEPQTHVKVGICCEVGRHRSVACVEELSRMEWPGGWEIEVVHRDLTRPRSERDKEKRSRKVARAEDSD
ncbi:hypothetical protein H0H87_009630 [Tephrocybe sp. NHM501043]|nr:hypothetical protein H0H87_009630 [Tephrocybe sp. NHM501043]